MASVYPGALDSFNDPGLTTKENDAGFEHDVIHTHAHEALRAVQATLGVDPQGSYATVAARLADLRSLGDAWQGGWDSGTTYAAGDVVAYDGSSWLALDDSTGSTPGAAETPVLAGSVTEGGTGQCYASPAAQGFTVNSTVTVLGVELQHWYAASPVASGQVVGITAADPLGTADPALTASGVTSSFSGGATGQVIFGDPITLNPGTTYWLVFKGSAGYSLSSTTAGTPALGGVLASVGTLRMDTNFTGTLSKKFLFGLLAAPPPVWTLVAEKGDTGATGPAGPSLGRGTLNYTTASLADGAHDLPDPWLDLPLGFRLLYIETSVAARVRLYTDSVSQAADESRPVGTDPTGDHGVLFDFVTYDRGDGFYSSVNPLVDGIADPLGCPAIITNLSGGTTTVDVHLYFQITEA